ncbi:DNA-processing protein DprA [Nitratifractor sp.]
MGAELRGDRIPEFAGLSKAPETIWYRGDLSLLERPKVSIVGSRRPYPYTRSVVTRLASELARRGVAVVSGAAMGVDALAHRGAGPSNTIAVVATGIDIRYPRINAPLIESIEREGLVLSRFEPGTTSRSWTFVVRNELVVALGEVLVIAQADRESGSLRSAEYALEQEKPIFVLPHRLGESEGTQDLLREGKAEAIYDIEAFADRFGRVHSAERADAFVSFCAKGPTLDEALARFGDRIYEAELEGLICIDGGRIVLNR